MTLQPPRTVEPRTVDLFVSGRWQSPRAGQYEPDTSPVTGELIGHVAQGDRADAGAAVQAAAAALGGWAAATALERARALHRVADACQQRRDELARALTLDQGKPLHAEAYPEVDDLIGYWRDAAEDVLRLDGTIPPSRLPGARVLIERRPLGVVAVITPWNWPYTMRHAASSVSCSASSASCAEPSIGSSGPEVRAGRGPRVHGTPPDLRPVPWPSSRTSRCCPSICSVPFRRSLVLTPAAPETGRSAAARFPGSAVSDLPTPHSRDGTRYGRTWRHDRRPART